MASQPHPLCPPPPCPTTNGSMGARGGQLAGDARLKPPVGPKPRMLPKPAVPAKPCAPPPSPGPRAPRLELPSAEKINLLAGPKPYSGSSTTLKRLSFGLKSPPEETPNGKGSPPPAARDPPRAMEEGLPAPVTPPAGGLLGVLKGATPFKVKPVAAKPERFPGTTVEEILAKMERPRKEGLGSPEQVWGLRSTFSLDGGSCFGPKGYAAFRRQSSTEGGEGGTVVPAFETSQESGSPEAQESRAPRGDEPVTGGRKREGSLSPSGQRPLEPPDGESERDPSPASRESGSSPAGASCDGDQSGHRRPPSPPGFSLTWTCPVPTAPAELPLGAPPGSPGTSAGLARAPAAPYLPAELLASAPGSSALPAELPAPGSPSAHANLPPRVRPSSPDTPESLAKISISLDPAPGVPAEPCRSISRSPGSPEAPGEGSPAPSGLPAGLAPGTPDAPTERLRSPPAGQPLAPGTPDAPTERPCSPPAGQPLAPGTPDAPAELSPRITHSPGAPKTPVLSLDAPSLSPKLPTRVARSPGSPDGPAESSRPSDSSPFSEQGSPSSPSDTRTFTGPAPAGEGFQPPQPGPRRSSDGLVQLPDRGLGMGVLGGSLAALPREGPPPSEQPLEGESNWSLSRSFEWAFPSRAPEWEPPRSPIREADDSGLSEEEHSDGEGLAPGPKGPGEGSGSKGLRPGHPSAAMDWQDVAAAESCARSGDATGARYDKGATEGRPGGSEATCPGGPVLQGELAVAEVKGPAGVEDAGAIWEEQDRVLLGTPPRLTEPGPGQEPAAPLLFSGAPRPASADPCQGDDSALGQAQAGSCQGGARPGEAGSEPHPDARWLDELLASPPPSADETKRKDTLEPGDPAGPEDLLGWSRKDLCSEFGIRGAHRAGEFGWASEPSTRRRDWPSGYGASEMEQDREFGTSTQDWAGAYKEMELLGDSSVGHGNWPDAYGIGNGCRPDGEHSTGKPDWSSQYNVGSAESQDGELDTMKLDWSSTYSIQDSTQQDMKFGIGKSNWTPEYSVGDAAQQDRDFGASQPDWTREHGVGDTDQQDKEFSSSKTDWTHKHGVGDTDQQDREFSTSKTDWTREYGISDTDRQDREFDTSQIDWTREHSGGGDTGQQDRGFDTGKPDWICEHRVSATDQQDREFGAGKSDWTRECSVKANGQGREFGAGQPDWTCEYGVGSTAPQDKEFGTDKPDWTQEFVAGDRAQQDRAFSVDKPDWLGECGIHHADRENAFSSGSRDQGGAGDPDHAAREPGARRPGWSGNESKFHFARRDGASDFEHESQFGIIGTDRAGGFVLSALDPSGAVGTLDPAGLGASPTDWAGRSRTVGLDEPREAGVGQSDWARDLGLRGMDPSVGLGAVRSDNPREHRGEWMDWTNELSVSSMDPSGGLGAGGSESPREAAEGQPDGASDLGMEGPATASGFGIIGLEELREARVRQTDWGRELGSGAEGSTETREAGAGQMDWDSDVGIGRGQQSHGCDTGGSEPHGDSSLVGPRLCDSSPLLEGMLAKAAAHCKSPISLQRPFSREEWGPSDTIDTHPPAAGSALPAPSPQEEEDGTRPEGDGAPSPSDATDGGWLSTDMRRLSQPSVPGEDFSFLEDTEILDSAIYRSRANLGRKRGHRAPALHPGGPWWPFEVEVADDWMFRDSTEPRAVRRVSSDEEVAEEPQSRRARPSPKGVKVSLFPGLNPSALKAKLRGRNRSAEEGPQLGEAKESQVQRSKSCKIPGLGGKPLVLPPKPEKSSGSDASSPHWLQALKLKKKKS
ncbi:182 kDa tankyrase-1-binding protein isoform X2 [Emydura macquarii macquarii]|uniref:182 kDa tankyrase-1-binding protein isoform X2 n=1 Tax=Emydura macquarii macquarii TaxID=1129001 RepID=UPI00352AEA65